MSEPIRRRKKQATNTQEIPKQPNGNGVFRDLLIKHLQQHPGEIVHIDDLVNISQGSKNSIQNSMRILVGSIPEIQVIVSGRSWRWNVDDAKVGKAPKEESRPEPEIGQQIFFKVGEDREGNPIIKDEHGSLYRATDL